MAEDIEEILQDSDVREHAAWLYWEKHPPLDHTAEQIHPPSSKKTRKPRNPVPPVPVSRTSEEEKNVVFDTIRESLIVSYQSLLFDHQKLDSRGLCLFLGLSEEATLVMSEAWSTGYPLSFKGFCLLIDNIQDKTNNTEYCLSVLQHMTGR